MSNNQKISNLKDLQQCFANNILTIKAPTNHFKANEYFSAEQLIRVYQNNYTHTFTQALKASYSAVYRLVGEDFFAYLAKSYLDKYPPKVGYLQRYGHRFSHFISTIKQCNHLAYLSDIALLEQYYEYCYYGQNVENDFSKYYSTNQAITSIKSLTKQTMTNSYLLQSPYPILAIWRLNKDSATLDINKGGDNVLLYKYGHTIQVIKIKTKEFQFLNKLKQNHHH